MINIYFYLGVLILAWTLNPFFKKKLMSKLNNEELFFINHIVITVFILLYFLYRYKCNKIKLDCINKLNSFSRNEIFLLIAGAIITVIGARLLPYLLEQNKDVSYIISHIQPVVIMLTVLIGYMFFKEKITLTKLLGVIFIVIGLIVINVK
ncbi:MAG: EamA family transporter [Bdellovibrionales bacterium]|jgi:uncharacterized membrane protein|nr:EamA family transporter [Bdellovibrionales bacterium]